MIDLLHEARRRPSPEFRTSLVELDKVAVGAPPPIAAARLNHAQLRIAQLADERGFVGRKGEAIERRSGAGRPMHGPSTVQCGHARNTLRAPSPRFGLIGQCEDRLLSVVAHDGVDGRKAAQDGFDLPFAHQAPPSFALKFSELAIAHDLDIAWGSFAMVDRHFGSRHFDAMARSGCDHLVIGLETMTDRVLKLVHKYATGADNLRFLKAAHAAGIALFINLIPDLPTTTYAEAIESLSRLDDAQDLLTSVAIFPFEATRSSQIGRTPERYGINVADLTGDSGQAGFASNHLRIVVRHDARGAFHRHRALFGLRRPHQRRTAHYAASRSFLGNARQPHPRGARRQ